MEYRKKGLAFQHAKPFLNSDFLFQKRDQSVGKACHTGHRLDCLAVFLVETDQDIVVCFGQIIDNTVDIGLHIFRKLNIQVLVCGDMQRIGNTEMIPQNIVQCGIFVDPHDLLDRDNSHGLVCKRDEKVLRDKHILGRQLRQRGKLLLRLC